MKKHIYLIILILTIFSNNSICIPIIFTEEFKSILQQISIDGLKMKNKKIYNYCEWLRSEYGLLVNLEYYEDSGFISHNFENISLYESLNIVAEDTKYSVQVMDDYIIFKPNFNNSIIKIILDSNIEHYTCKNCTWFEVFIDLKETFTERLRSEEFDYNQLLLANLPWHQGLQAADPPRKTVSYRNLSFREVLNRVSQDYCVFWEVGFPFDIWPGLHAEKVNLHQKYLEKRSSIYRNLLLKKGMKK